MDTHTQQQASRSGQVPNWLAGIELLQNHEANQGGRFSRDAIERNIADLPPHGQIRARRRFGYLLSFLITDIRRGGVGRVQTRREVAEQLTRQHPEHPISHKSLERYEKYFTKWGVLGLAGPPLPKAEVEEAGLHETASLPDQLRHVASRLMQEADRLERATRQVGKEPALVDGMEGGNGE